MRRVDRSALFVLSARFTRLLSWVPRGSTAEGYACADTLAQIKFFANLWVSIVGRDWTEYDEEDEDMYTMTKHAPNRLCIQCVFVLNIEQR